MYTNHMAHSLIINAGYEDSDHYNAEEIFRMVLIAAGTYIFYHNMLFLYLHRKKNHKLRAGDY